MSLKTAVNKFDAEYQDIADKLVKKIKALTRTGISVDLATDMAIKEIGIDRVSVALHKSITEAVRSNGISITLSNQIVASWERNYRVSGADLSQRIYQTVGNTNVIVRQEVQRAMNKVQGWEGIARQAQREIKITGDTPKYINRLKAIADRGLDKATQREIRSAINAAEREVRKLSQGAAPTKRLQSAYGKVVDAIGKGKADMIDKAIERAVKEKSYYNAQRLARTETAKAYGDSFFDQINQDDDVEAWRSVLSPRHPVSDICDFYANADLYGLGKGVYPKNESPPYPYHPNCLCELEPVYQLKPSGKPDAGKFIKNASDEKLQYLFGDAADQVRENPSDWKRHLIGYKEFVNH